MMYCITHNGYGFPVLSMEDCVWVSSLPPVLDSDWDLSVSEPSPEELAQMDENADLLLFDLEI